MVKHKQKVCVKLPGIRQMPIIRTDVCKIRKSNRAFIGQYQDKSGQAVKVWRRISGDTWRPLS